MLGSITPLGERGRMSRWGRTVAAFVIGSLVSGAAFGAALGWAGRVVVGRVVGPGGGVEGQARLAVLAALIVIGLALDARLFGLRLPTVHRQVNEEWLRRYRGWVYGVGFGFQLGLGLVTVVATSAVYLAFAAAFLSSSPVWGGIVGGTFGLARALPMLAVRRVSRSDLLGAVDARLRRWDRPSLKLALAAEAGVAAAAFAAVAAAIVS